jgi:hypothetical protein
MRRAGLLIAGVFLATGAGLALSAPASAAGVSGGHHPSDCHHHGHYYGHHHGYYHGHYYGYGYGSYGGSISVGIGIHIGD